MAALSYDGHESFTCCLSEGDSMTCQVGMKFSTSDKDRDTMPHRNCAATEKGGW